jgi:hypothetical protein
LCFWFVFSSFFFFFWTTSFTFSALSIFVSISKIPFEILYHVQYRTPQNKSK